PRRRAPGQQQRQQGQHPPGAPSASCSMAYCNTVDTVLSVCPVDWSTPDISKQPFISHMFTSVFSSVLVSKCGSGLWVPECREDPAFYRRRYRRRNRNHYEATVIAL
ncbi:unnamed protein product, partial [Meganyctiphanes norvegica]